MRSYNFDFFYYLKLSRKNFVYNFSWLIALLVENLSFFRVLNPDYSLNDLSWIVILPLARDFLGSALKCDASLTHLAPTTFGRWSSAPSYSSPPALSRLASPVNQRQWLSILSPFTKALLFRAFHIESMS